MFIRLHKLSRHFLFYVFVLLIMVFVSKYTNLYVIENDEKYTNSYLLTIIAFKTTIVCYCSMVLSLIICHFIVKKESE